MRPSPRPVVFRFITKAQYRLEYYFWLAVGSLPAALLTLWFISTGWLDTATLNKIIKITLGYALVLTALAVLFKTHLVAYAHRKDWWITRLQGNSNVGPP